VPQAIQGRGQKSVKTRAFIHSGCGWMLEKHVDKRDAARGGKGPREVIIS